MDVVSRIPDDAWDGPGLGNWTVRSLVGLEQELQGWYHADKATPKRHRSYRSRNRLDKHILNRSERVAQMTRNSPEPGKPNKGAWHGHTGDPSSLEAKVRV